MSRAWYIGGWAVAVAASISLFLASLFLGELNQDEGWYLYAARLVSQGQRPYVDFASTQGPVMPFVYAAAQPLVGSMGVAGGRLFTAVLGFLSLLITAWLAARLAPGGFARGAALAAFVLSGVNVYQCYFTTVVKTYALAGLLLALSFVALSYAARSARWALSAGVLAALATGTRSSAGAVIPIVLGGFLLGGLLRRDTLRRAVAYGAGAAVTLAALFVPFVLRAPQAVWFALMEYHAGRKPGSMTSMLAYKAGFISRLVNAYSVAAFFLLACLVVLYFSRRQAANTQKDALSQPAGALSLATLWTCVAAVTAVHFMTPFPYDDYQVMVFPLAAAAISILLMRAVCILSCQAGEARRQERQWADAVVAVVVAAHLLLACASPMLQGWFVGKRDRIWWPLRKEFPLAKLQRVAKTIRSECGGRPGQTLLTQDAYLAYEAGMALPRGMELGPFSYFPEWSDEKAEACRVLNRPAMLKALWTTDARVAAFSGYGLSIRAPEVSQLTESEQGELWAAVRERYMLYREEPEFGQADTTLRIFVRKEPQAGAGGVR